VLRNGLKVRPIILVTAAGHLDGHIYSDSSTLGCILPRVNLCIALVFQKKTSLASPVLPGRRLFSRNNLGSLESGLVITDRSFTDESARVFFILFGLPLHYGQHKQITAIAPSIRKTSIEARLSI